MPRHRKAYPDLKAYLKDLPKQGKNQGDFAAELQMSQGYLSDLKNGRVNPSLRLAKKLAERCNIPIESFSAEERVS